MQRQQTSRVSNAARLAFAGLFSLALHVALLVLVSYVQPDWKSVASQKLLQVRLEHRSSEMRVPKGVPLASRDSEGRASIGVRSKNFSSRQALPSIEQETIDHARAEVFKSFISQKILAIDKPQPMQIAEQRENPSAASAVQTPQNAIAETQETGEGDSSLPPAVAKPVAPAAPSSKKLLSAEPPVEKQEKIMVAEPIGEKPAPAIGEQKPAKAEEHQLAKMEEPKLARTEAAELTRSDAPAEPKSVPEGARPEGTRAQAPDHDTSKQPFLSIPLVRKIALGDDKSKRPGERRKAVGVREQDIRYAMYIESLRLKLERIGALNYPATASGESVSGTLSVRISVRADGTLEEFSIVRQASHDALNAGAEKIVRMSAPFSPLPEDIRRETDILAVTFRWTFAKSRQSFD